MKNNYRVAVLIMGTYREVEFILRLFPYLAGTTKYDIFLVLRHVKTSEKSRLGSQEKDFGISKISHLLNENIFLCELPSIDPKFVESNYLIPVGPNTAGKECGIISMFQGVFAAISMMKASLRDYTHVLKIRTDYQPRITPWIDGIIDFYENSGNRIVVDHLATVPMRYGDKKEIPWQGSISDLLLFASKEQFLKFWDIESLLPSIWTGVPETTLFRSAMIRFLGDEKQSPRKNSSFLKKYFVWQEHKIMHPTKEFKTTLGQTVNLLRPGILTSDLKDIIIELLHQDLIPINLVNELIRFSYDYISSNMNEASYKKYITRHFDDKYARKIIDLSKKAKKSYLPNPTLLHCVSS